MNDPVWLNRARAALRAATEGSDSVGIEVAKLLSDEQVGSDGLILAVLWWVDRLIEGSDPATVTAPAPVPDIWPVDMDLSQRWALQMVAARINDDQDEGQRLMVEASRDFDYLTECVGTLVILAGLSLAGRL
ncbi:hypothetical protein ACQPZ2_30695 [Nocardia pseudovaccinii]|uniref:hypothetical protein n=1 Tax=Nocardia pseudovaccinii TaxID=189540 RepID=UPI003D8CE89D